MQSTFSSAVTRKCKKIVLLSDSILKNLQMGEFNSFMKNGEVSLKVFPEAKARQLNHHTIPVLQDSTYDAAAIHVGINDLLRAKGHRRVRCVLMMHEARRHEGAQFSRLIKTLHRL